MTSPPPTASRALRRLLAVLLAGACADVTNPLRPGAPALTETMGVDTVQVGGGELYVAGGFRINLFASAEDGVRGLALGPGGAVFATRPGYGEIVRFTDVDGDGVRDGRSVVLSGLDRPSGLAFRGDTMYFAEPAAVKRVDPGATTPVTIISNLPTGENLNAGGHWTRTIVFGPDNRLYLAVGSSCDVCDEPPPRAAVTRFELDGSNPHTFATGLRNSVGLAFNPRTLELWANNNGHDNMGDDQPPEQLNILRDGKWYGWPRCSLPNQPNAEYPDADCSGVEPPAITFPAHAAPLGLAFYTGSTFPAEYQGDAFMTYHGSINRSVPLAPRVVRVRIQGDRPTEIRDFVAGWQSPDGSRLGRPASLLVAPDGALLVSDDWGGRIWRVSHPGHRPPGRPRVTGLGGLGPGPATPGSNRQSFEFDARGDSADRLRFSDFTYVRADGTVGTLTMDAAADPSTEITSFARVSAACVSFGGTGRLDYGPLVGFSLSACDRGSPGAGVDSITLSIPWARYQRSALVAEGDIALSVDSTTQSPTGDADLITLTTGSDIPQGYTALIDDFTYQPVTANDTVRLTGLLQGEHSVVLTDQDGTAAHCLRGLRQPAGRERADGRDSRNQV